MMRWSVGGRCATSSASTPMSSAAWEEGAVVGGRRGRDRVGVDADELRGLVDDAVLVLREGPQHRGAQPRAGPGQVALGEAAVAEAGEDAGGPQGGRLVL